MSGCRGRRYSCSPGVAWSTPIGTHYASSYLKSSSFYWEVISILLVRGSLSLSLSLNMYFSYTAASYNRDHTTAKTKAKATPTTVTVAKIGPLTSSSRSRFCIGSMRKRPSHTPLTRTSTRTSRRWPSLCVRRPGYSMKFPGIIWINGLEDRRDRLPKSSMRPIQ